MMQERRELDTVLAIPEPSAREVEEQLARILKSPSFRNSTVLQSFLRFVTQTTMKGRSATISEYTIATEVFRRGPDFNPAADTIVRTQAYRLRMKLDEYYKSDGCGDRISIEIPKGHYVPAFSFRAAGETSTGADSREPNGLVSTQPRGEHKLAWIALLVLAAFGLGAALDRVASQKQAEHDLATVTDNSVDAFWQSFIDSDRQPIVAFTNASYLATDSGDFFAFRDGPVGDRGAAVDPAVAKRFIEGHHLPPNSQLYFEDDVTGVGDVLAAVAVSNALVHAGAQPTFKRGKLLTTYDLENHNVVFIGSPFVNELLNDLPAQPKFAFHRATTPPLLWASQIEDTDSGKGRTAAYGVERAPRSRVIVTDYAVVTGVAGLKPARKILIFGGLTTSGTAAAAQFATASEGMADMTRRLRRTPRSKQPWPAYFEYLIRVHLSRGLDAVRSECVAAHFN